MGLYAEEESDKELSYQLLRSLERATIDYTLFFRKLSRYDGNKSDILDICVSRDSMEKWLDKYSVRLEKETQEASKRHEKMLAVNPKYILKNHILQESIVLADKGDYSMVQDLLKVSLSPCEEHPNLDHLSKSAPMESKNIKLSCSS